MKKILIVGCGYVGKAIALSLKKKGFYIGATTRNSANVPILSQYCDKVHVLINPSDLSEFLLGYEIIFFAVAAENAFCYEEAYLKNAELIVQVLKDALQSKQIIYTSSTSVYGEHHGNWVNEKTELKGDSPQAQILIETENKLLELSQFSHAVCIFRLGEIIGPDREIKTRLARIQGTTLPGDGSNYTNFSPLELMIKAFNIAINQRIQGIFNLCSPNHVPRKELYDQICCENKFLPVNWDETKKSIHSSNKRVSSDKFFSTFEISKCI